MRSFKGSRIEGSLHQEKWSKIPYFQCISLRSVFARFFEGGWGGGGVSRIVQMLYILLTLPIVTVVLKLAVLLLRKHGLCKF